MPKYVMIKHYRGAPTPPNDAPMPEWSDAEVNAHLRYMDEFADRLRRTGEYVDSHALSESGTWVRYDGEDRPPLVDGPLPESSDLVAGWMTIDVADHDRALELAAELSAAPGAGGEPIGEWLELRPVLEMPSRSPGGVS